ncbi:ATP-binding cassette sub-family A member 2-like [Ornithodoros turicata]|uniref:ATP-binding cassette sub-family A member 2-like n=1 Tax=Ornithodoros turicata TaxID=34597 RepID=UPI003139593F
MAFFRQLGVFLWRDLWVYRVKRHYIVALLEVAVPLLLVGILVWISQMNGKNDSGHIVRVGPTLYPEFTPSVTLPLPRSPLYAPNGTYTTALMEAVFGKGAKGFPTQDAMYDFIARDALQPGSKGLQLAVVFPAASAGGSVPHDLRYTVRFNNTFVHFDTNQRYSIGESNGPRPEDKAYEGLFWGLQNRIFSTHLELLNTSGKLIKEPPEVTMNRFPYPEYNSNSGSSMVIMQIVPFMVGFLVFGLVFVSRLIREKSSRIRELMRMMGLSDWVYWLGSFSNGFVIMATVSVILVVLLKVEVAPNVAVLYFTDFSLLLVILLLYSVASLLFLLLFTIIFNSPVVGVVFSVIGWVVSYAVPTTLLDPQGSDRYYTLSAKAKLLTSLLPNTGLHWCFRLINFLEVQGIGASWSNLYVPAVPADNIVLGQVMLLMLASTFLYSFLIWYLDNVWPYQYGIPKHPLYFLQISYWRPPIEDYNEVLESLRDDKDDVDSIEPAPADAHVSIQLFKVTKEFHGAEKKAVDDLSLKMYQGQITALLGHNGAGKTTTMNMITGLFPPTRGHISINGHNILRSTKRAREDLGLCPQHNVLFDEMTVQEHLYFFLSLKKGRGLSWREEVDQVLTDLNLGDKRHTQARNLSGGMKRKLSLGNAIIGGSKTLILDEPTAGMDPQARRAVWTLLQRLRMDCTILLTTHYMEEADALGDRIAFLAHGRLRCCGSALFLKKKFGTGYRMRIARSGDCDVTALTETVERMVPSSELVSDVGSEVIFNLGFPPAAKMVLLFKELEDHKTKHGITSMGVSVTTMEDVFIRVGELSDTDTTTLTTEYGSIELPNGFGSSSSDEPVTWEPHQHVTGVTLLLQQTRAMFLKRIYSAYRHYYLIVFMLLVPVLIVTLYCWIGRESVQDQDHSITYDVGDVFGTTVGFLGLNTTELADFGTKIYGPAMADEKVQVKRLKGAPDDFLLDVARRDLTEYSKDYLVGGVANGSRVVAWYNGEPHHVGAMSLNLAHEAVLRFVTGNASASVTVMNDPFAGDMFTGLAVITDGLVIRLVAAIFIPSALSFLSSSFVLFPTEERVSKAKLLQLMAGVPIWLFWAVSFMWDFLLHAICCSIIMLPLFIINPKGAFLSSAQVGGPVYVLLLAYGWASIPLSYFYSFIKKKPSSAYALLTTVNVLVGVIPSLVMTILYFMVNMQVPLNKASLDNALWFFRLIPNFALTWGFANLNLIGMDPWVCSRIPNKAAVCDGPTKDLGFKACCNPCPQGSSEQFCYIPRDPLEWDINAAGPDVCFMLFVGAGLFVLLLLMDSWLGILCESLWSRLSTMCSSKKTLVDADGTIGGAKYEDGEVTAEHHYVEQLVQSGQASSQALVAFNLTRSFGSLVAVDNLSFHVMQHECFGLLGVNGAGKTTTFRMLTGDLSPSSGNAFIGSADLKHQLKKFQSAIGYCPQFDAQLNKLSGRETLEMFALLRGVPSDVVAGVVSEMIDLCDLKEHANKTTENYSGGTKRKLSIGMALIGRPPVIFFDEPTAGVDPAARRRIWHGLQEMQGATGAAYVLTSHSMEECEALCQRLSIMVNGTFRCLGSTQHLKAKFGQGFTVLVKLSPGDSLEVATTSATISSLCARMEEEFPGAWELKDSHQCLLHFHLHDTNLKWSHLFERMEALKQELGYEDYVVSDTTLEQIFLAFARTQRESEKEVVV